MGSHLLQRSLSQVQTRGRYCSSSRYVKIGFPGCRPLEVGWRYLGGASRGENEDSQQAEGTKLADLSVRVLGSARRPRQPLLTCWRSLRLLDHCRPSRSLQDLIRAGQQADTVLDCAHRRGRIAQYQTRVAAESGSARTTAAP